MNDWILPDIRHWQGFWQYNPNDPLLFTGFRFLVLFFLFCVAYYFLRNKVSTRNYAIILFSAFFYYLSSGAYLILFIALSGVSYLLTLLICKTSKAGPKKALLWFTISLYLAVLVYYKYLGFFIGTLLETNLQKQAAFSFVLPLGISFFTFEMIAYTVDAYHARFKALTRFSDYLVYLSFFPHLVAGPIVRPADFIPQVRALHFPDSKTLKMGALMLISGLIKKGIVSDYIGPNFADRVFDQPALYTGFENLLAVYAYAIQIYCDFSGYTDMAIGLALLLGFHLPLNFDHPYISTSITEFWKRWHISLSSWLRDYLYIPLGGNRKGKIRTQFNLLLTMLLGGLWHGANWKFVIWGGLHGLALSIERLSGFERFAKQSGWRRLLGLMITFHVVCFAWIFFRAADTDTAFSILNRIAFAFHPELIGTILAANSYLLPLMTCGLLGHALHRAQQSMQEWFLKMPLYFAAILLGIVIWLVFQIASSDVTPFIYFQF